MHLINAFSHLKKKLIDLHNIRIVKSFQEIRDLIAAAFFGSFIRLLFLRGNLQTPHAIHREHKDMYRDHPPRA